MTEKPILASSLAAKLERAYKSAGFKVFWDQVLREKRRAEVYVLSTPRHDVQPKAGRDSVVIPGLTEREFNYRKGWLDALLQIERMKEELLSGLMEGKIPWRQLRPPEESDDESGTHSEEGSSDPRAAWERSEAGWHRSQQEGESGRSHDAGDDAEGDDAESGSTGDRSDPS